MRVDLNVAVVNWVELPVASSSILSMSCDQTGKINKNKRRREDIVLLVFIIWRIKVYLTKYLIMCILHMVKLSLILLCALFYPQFYDPDSAYIEGRGWWKGHWLKTGHPSDGTLQDGFTISYRCGICLYTGVAAQVKSAAGGWSVVT
jgi:hypothetical protein